MCKFIEKMNFLRMKCRMRMKVWLPNDDSMKAYTYRKKKSFNNWLLWSQTFSHSPLSPLRSFCYYDYCRRRRCRFVSFQLRVLIISQNLPHRRNRKNCHLNKYINLLSTATICMEISGIVC